ncbi:hypothetical protein Emag_003158 [Eimeria magna]
MGNSAQAVGSLKKDNSISSRDSRNSSINNNNSSKSCRNSSNSSSKTSKREFWQPRYSLFPSGLRRGSKRADSRDQLVTGASGEV